MTRPILQPRGQPCAHNGDQLAVGPYTVWAGSWRLRQSCLSQVNLLVSLGGELPVEPGDICTLPVLWLPLEDFGSVPPNWKQLLEQKIIPQLANGQRLVFFCHAGHGRTGTALASLIALLESRQQTPDPIQALRSRYCHAAVETAQQAAAVFALRGQRVPPQYKPRTTRKRRSS